MAPARGILSLPFRLGYVPAGWHVDTATLVAPEPGLFDSMELDSPNGLDVIFIHYLDPAAAAALGRADSQSGSGAAALIVNRDARHQPRITSMGAVSQATVERVARSIDFSAVTSITFPFRLTHLPAGLHPSYGERDIIRSAYVVGTSHRRST